MDYVSWKGDWERKQKEVMKEIQTRFSGTEEKLWNVRTSGEALLFLRQLGSQKQRAIAFRDFRPHLLSDTFSFSPSQDEVSRVFFSFFEKYIMFSFNSGD